VQPQPHVVAGREHETQVRSRPHDQQLELPQSLGVRLMHVIDRQPEWVFQQGQILE
jgi:hypothetical protein